MRILTLPIFICALAALALSCHTSPPSSPSLAVRWDPVSNDYHILPARSVNRLALINKDGQLPAKGWRVYFNSNRAVIDSIPQQGNLRITHVNGDLFYLSPVAGDAAGASSLTTATASSPTAPESSATAGASSLTTAPAKELYVQYTSADLSINISDAPLGFYLVWDTKPDQGYAISDYTITPVADDSLRLLTPQMIYTQNAVIKELPSSALPDIFPTPVSCKRTGLTLHYNSQGAANYDPAFTAEGEYLSGLQLHLPISLEKKALDTGAYELTIDTTHIRIAAASGEGIFYGIQSLLSLLHAPDFKPGILPGLEVKDYPRFRWRGFMIDVARHFRDPKEIRRILDLMALYKMNVLHFHLTDDEGWRLQIPGLPELTSTSLPPSFGSGPVGDKGFYSRQEFIDLLRYAGVRHIQVIPEIESPGHARAAIKAMDARYEAFKRSGRYDSATYYLLRDTLDTSHYESAQLWHDNVICPALPSTYRFMQKVIDEVAGMYTEAGVPLTTIHLGGDEVPAGAWEGSPLCQQLAGTKASKPLRAYCWSFFYHRLDSLLQKKGLPLSGWEEVAATGIKTAHLHVWDNTIGGGNEDLPYHLANNGFPVILSCVSNNYYDLAYTRSFEEKGYHWGGFQDMDKPFSFIPFDYYRNSTIDYQGRPIDPAYFKDKEQLTKSGQKNILGIEGLLWAENLPSNERLEYMLLPKLLGTAERAWAQDPQWNSSEAYDNSWNIFLNELGQKELPRLSRAGYTYRIPPPGAIVRDGKLTANSPMPGLVIRYTLDGSSPTVQSPLYTQPISQKGAIRLSAFDTKGNSSRVITVQN